MSERVRIQIGDKESHIVERFELRRGVFSVPGAFAARLGDGSSVAKLSKQYRNGLPITVWIDLPSGQSVPQMTGLLEEGSNDQGAGATELNLRARDWMAPLFDSKPEVERTFTRATYRELVEACLRGAGIPDFSLTAGNEANRAAVQGVPRFETVQAPYQPSEVVQRLHRARLALQGAAAAGLLLPGTAAAARAALEPIPTVMVDVTRVVGYDVPHPLKIKPGTTWWSFLQKELNRVGLFMFAGVDEKNFILCKPNVSAKPTFRIHRRRGDSREIIGARFRNAATRRHCKYVVYGRSLGDANGPKQVKGEVVDDEMVGWGFPLERVDSEEDKDVKTTKQALFRARRKMAEARRNGWDLAYRYMGLTGPIVGSSLQRAIWTPDSMVEVIDEEYEIEGIFWLESTGMNGQSRDGHTCDLTLHRPADLVFGDDA